MEHHASWRHGRAIFIVLLALNAAPVRAQSEPVLEKQVLVLHSTRRTSQMVVVSDREIPAILESVFPKGVDYYTEFVDEARYPSRQYQQAFEHFLRSKYSGLRFDLVVAMGDNALEFVADTRRELFPETPVVFFSTRPAVSRPANSTGVVAPLNLSGSLRLALALQPDLRRVFVVSATDDSNRGYEVEARAQFRSFEDRVDLTFLSDLSKKDLEAKLATLPEHSIVYFLTFSRHGADESFRPIEYLERIVAVANSPTYSWVDSAMDRGVVGGSLKSQTAQAQAVAQLGLRVLSGERADTIPVASVDLNVNQVDWRELRRFGISETRIPAGTIVRFRDPTLWDRYRSYIVGAGVVLLAQTTLILGLLLQKRRRQFAERQARDSAEKLRSSYERIRDLGGRLLGAQEAERARIARELHDDVSQQLALLAIDLDLMRGESQLQRRRRVDELVQGAFNRAQDVAKSVHDLSHRLHPGRLQIGLVAALSGLERELSAPGLQITFSHEDVPDGLDADVTLCLFRVAQEALHNAHKHSAARHVFVRLRGNDPRRLVLTVTDDGVGFNVDAAWSNGLGLVSIAERVESVGGRLNIRSVYGEGTFLEVSVPLATARLSAEVVAFHYADAPSASGD
jgi:signal transduction histidine kinase